MNPDPKELSRLEERLGHVFEDRTLFVHALTHKSFTNENPGLKRQNNERLEFLGDAVLSLVISDHLYKRYPELNEGALSKIRANLVNENSLAAVARGLDLGRYLFLGKGEEGTGGRDKESLLSDALEAVLAGIYRDAGIRKAGQIVLRHFKDLIAHAVERKRPFDFKTTLQELCQERCGVLPEYRLTRTSGPDHNRVFVMELLVNGEVLGVGSGKSKKEAQQQSARDALERFKKRYKRRLPASPGKGRKRGGRIPEGSQAGT